MASATAIEADGSWLKAAHATGALDRVVPGHLRRHDADGTEQESPKRA